MTPCQERGWKVGDRFIVTDPQCPAFEYKSEVELFEDDESDCPLFKLINGHTEHHCADGLPGAYIHLNHIRPVGGKPMTDNRKELKRQLAETRAQMERLEAELEQAEQWEPEGGDFYVVHNGTIVNWLSSWGTCKFGTERPTLAQAERARDLMRVHNRALAYVQEHAPDFDPEKEEAWEVYWSYINLQWRVSGSSVTRAIGTVVGPRHVMNQLAADLNSGRVKL